MTGQNASSGGPNASIGIVYGWGLDHTGAKDFRPGEVSLAEAIARDVPNYRRIATTQRAFTLRLAEALVRDCGVRRLLDLGAGQYHEPNVDDIAHALAPETRIVYSDLDRVILAHRQARSRPADDRIQFLPADLRDPGAILDSEPVRDMLAPGEPVGMMLSAVLHFIRDEDDPAGILGTLTAALPRGSYLGLSHASFDLGADALTKLIPLYAAHGLPIVPRDRATIERMVTGAGWTILDPGIVSSGRWRPRPGEAVLSDSDSGAWALLARVP